MGATLARCCCKQVEESTIDPEKAFNLEQLREDCKAWKTGDILLEHYSDAAGAALKGATNSQWTHVGIVYVDRDTNRTHFIEITLKGVLNYEIVEHATWFLERHEKHYIGYRALDPPLSDEQIEKFKAGFEALKSKEYGGALDMVGAVCDCGLCCVTTCNDKENEQQRMEKLFCSELSAELLQRAGVMKTDIESDGMYTLRGATSIL